MTYGLYLQDGFAIPNSGFNSIIVIFGIQIFENKMNVYKCELLIVFWSTANYSFFPAQSPLRLHNMKLSPCLLIDIFIIIMDNICFAIRNHFFPSIKDLGDIKLNIKTFPFHFYYRSLIIVPTLNQKLVQYI